MPVTEKSYIPYASSAPVLLAIRKLRDNRLSEKIDQTQLERIGVPSGSTGRVIAALRFLGLLDESGNRTELADRLSRVKSEEYPVVLAEVLQAAYSEVFVNLDPGTASEVDLHDAFRGFDPAKQRSRMVTLFVALCREARIMEGEPPSTAAVSRLPQRNKPPAGNGKGSKAPEAPTPPPGISNPPPIQSSAPDAGIFSGRYGLLHKLQSELLPASGIWQSDEERDIYLTAYQALLNALTRVKNTDRNGDME